jgi:hypothetical protein
MDSEVRDDYMIYSRVTVCLYVVQQFREEGISSLSRHILACSEKLRRCHQPEKKQKHMQRRHQDSLSVNKNSTLNRW